MKRDYEYYETKKPFYRIMNELCDFDFSNKPINRELSFGTFTVPTRSNTCYITYDMKKLSDNWTTMLSKLKRTNAYKTCDTIRKWVDELKGDIFEYENVREFNGDMQCIFSLSRVDRDGSFQWDIKNQYYPWE